MSEGTPEIDAILLDVVEVMEGMEYEVEIVRLTSWANIHFRVNEPFRRNVYTLQVLVKRPNDIRMQISDAWNKKRTYNYVSIEKFEKGIKRNFVNKVI